VGTLNPPPVASRIHLIRQKFYLQRRLARTFALGHCCFTWKEPQFVDQIFEVGCFCKNGIYLPILSSARYEVV